MNALRAALCCVLLMAAPNARAADKVIAGSLGGQAPLWAIYVAVHKGFFAARESRSRAELRRKAAPP